MTLTLTILTSTASQFELAVSRAMKNNGPYLVEWLPPLGNGSGFAPVRVIAGQSAYSAEEMAFKIGIEYESIQHEGQPIEKTKSI
jgi:hypothetical protein